MKFLCYLIFGLFAATGFSASTPELLISFQGKGTSVAWDLGVLQAMVERVPAVANGNVIITGNSGGSVMAAYFSCHKMNAASIKNSTKVMEALKRLKLDEGDVSKIQSLMLNSDSTVSPHQNLSEILDLITDHGACKPHFPVAIMAANANVLDNRLPRVLGGLQGSRVMQGVDRKVIDQSNFSVSLDGNLLGKACIYFVDKSMFDILSRVPYTERWCDLRLMETAADLRLAVLASVAEPTYFPEIAEPNVSKLGGFENVSDEIVRAQTLALANAERAQGDKDLQKYRIVLTPEQIRAGFQEKVELAKRISRGEVLLANGKSVSRSYAGGFVFGATAHDIKRAMPHLFVVGTGRMPLSRTAEMVVKAWYLIKNSDSTPISEWILDMEVEPYDRKLIDGFSYTNEQMFFYGCVKAFKCLSGNAGDLADDRYCRPQGTTKPYFNWALGDKTQKPMVSQRGYIPMTKQPWSWQSCYLSK